MQINVGTVRYITAQQAAAVDYIWETQLVIGYVADDEQPYAYPISILNFHEIVNETLAGRPVLGHLLPPLPQRRGLRAHDRR